jgi:hypothetical protein
MILAPSLLNLFFRHLLGSPASLYLILVVLLPLIQLYAANRHTKATQLAELDEVRELFISNRRDVAPKMFDV